MVWISVEVRDSRVGRDPDLVIAEGGEVLLRFETDVPYHVGDPMRLPDGTGAKVIDVDERISHRGVQIVTVSDTWG